MMTFEQFLKEVGIELAKRTLVRLTPALEPPMPIQEILKFKHEPSGKLFDTLQEAQREEAVHALGDWLHGKRFELDFEEADWDSYIKLARLLLNNWVMKPITPGNGGHY